MKIEVTWKKAYAEAIKCKQKCVYTFLEKDKDIAKMFFETWSNSKRVVSVKML